VFFARFHTVSWYRPYPLGKVDFVPSRTDDFPSTGCSQDKELKSPRGDSVSLTKFGHERANFGIGKGCVVLDFTDFGGGWE